MDKAIGKMYFVLGYCYALAEQAKSLGLFEDLTTMELAKIYFKNSLDSWTAL